jgi:hypothetical protein
MDTPILGVDMLLYILGGIILILGIWVIRLEVKLKRFLRGSNAASLEESFMHIKNSADRQITINQEIAKEIDRLDARLLKGLRGFETVRFNAFQGTGSGGNQSYAVALLNEEGDGLILSSLYGRDRFSAFAKPVKKGVPEFELSKEEAAALTNALGKLS